MFMPPGNLDSDPARPDATPQEEAVRIVEAIKARRPIPVIVIAAQPEAREPVLAAGADYFLGVPAQPWELSAAVAGCLEEP
jgi:hypothetical protein